MNGFYKYIFALDFQSLIKQLENQGVKSDVIAFLNSIPDEQKGHYIGYLRKNPQIELHELKNNVKIPEKKQIDAIDNRIINTYNDETYKKWVLRELRKLKIPQTGKFRGMEDYSDNQIIQEIMPKFNEIYDWYRAFVREYPKFEIANLNLDQAKIQSDEWHELMSGKGTGKVYDPFKRDESGNIVDERLLYRFKDGWMAVRLLSKNDLETEGNLMNHCVGGYCYEVQNEGLIICSIRDEYNKPRATISLEPGLIIEQIKGRSNSKVDSETRKHVGEFLAHIGAKFPGETYEHPRVEWSDSSGIGDVVGHIYQEVYGVGEDLALEEMDAYGSAHSDWDQDYRDYDIQTNHIYEEPDILDIDFDELLDLSIDASLNEKYYQDDAGKYQRYFPNNIEDEDFNEVSDALANVAIQHDIELLRRYTGPNLLRGYRSNYDSPYSWWKNKSAVMSFINKIEDKIKETQQSTQEVNEKINEGLLPESLYANILQTLENKVKNDKTYMDLYKKVTNQDIVDFPHLATIAEKVHGPQLFYHSRDEKPIVFHTGDNGDFGWKRIKMHPHDENDTWQYPVLSKTKLLIKLCQTLDNNYDFIESDKILNEIKNKFFINT